MASVALSGCQLTEEEKEKLEQAGVDLSQLADQIIITNPANFSEVSTSMVVVRADIPTSANAQAVTLFVDGIEIASDTNGSPWEINWPAYYYADGNLHTLLLKTTTGEGVEVRNNQQFQLTVLEEANGSLGFTSGLDGKVIQDQNTLPITFNAFPAASKYQVSYDTEIIETTDTQVELSELTEGIHEVRYRAIYDYSQSTSLVGPWSNKATFEVIIPLPEMAEPAVEYSESAYQVNLSWEEKLEGDSYEVFWAKTGEVLTSIGNTSETSFVLNSIEMGSYNWAIKRTNALGQSSDISSSKAINLGVFKRQFGGSADDYAKQLVATQDGGVVILASTKSKGDSQGDDWFIKLDAIGNTEWEYILSKTGFDRLRDLKVFSDGSIFAIGTNGNWQDSKGYLIKLSGENSPENRVLWELEYRKDQVEKEYFSSLAELNGELYVIGGERECTTNNGSTSCPTVRNNLYNINANNGNLINTVAIPHPNGALLDGLGYLSTTSDSQLLLACSAKPEVTPEDVFMMGAACIVKFDTDGNLSWSWESTGDYSFLNGRYAAEAPWGGFVLAGQDMMADGNPIATFNENGIKLGTYLASDGYSNQRETLAFTDNAILRLVSGSRSDYPELWSTSRYGTTEIKKVFSELKYDYSYPRSLVKSKDGGLYLLFSEAQSGYNNQDIIILKTDIEGNM